MSELPTKELDVVNALDVAELLGTPEERFRFALDKALQYLRERDAAKSSAGLAWAEHAKLLTENTRLRAFRDAIYAKIYEDAGNKDNPFAYMWQDAWDKIKAAEKGDVNAT